MTEYDYSPDAYEKHMAKMESIDHWRRDTRRTPQANPFSPPTPMMPPPLTLDHPKPKRRSSSHRRHASHSGAIPPRSHTTPPQGDVYGQYYPQQQMHYATPHSSRIPSPLSPQASYGPPSSRPVYHVATPPRTAPQRSQTYMYAMNSVTPVRPPVRSATLPTTPYTAYPAAGQQPYYQNNQYAAASQSRLASPVQMGPKQHPVIPTASYYQKQDPPLIKKMFGFLGSSGSKRRNHSRRDSF